MCIRDRSYSPYDPKWTRIKIQCELVNVKKQRISVSAVSYTHLDVYKRQMQDKQQVRRL